MTIIRAFHFVITSDQAFSLGYARQSILNMRVKARKGIYPEDAVMRKALVAAKWRRTNEERWSKK